MSEIKVNSIKGVGASAAAITVNNSDGTCTANITNNLSNRNIVKNGAMMVDQRNSGSTATSSPSGSSVYGCDRMLFSNLNTGELTLTLQQVTDAPAGFYYSQKVTVATPESSGGTPAADDRTGMQYRFEGYDINHLNLGTANAKDFVVSFYIKVSVAGNYGLAIVNNSGSRSYCVLFAATTSWTRVSIKVPKDTSGTYAATNAEGLALKFGFYNGSSRVGSDQGITGTGSWQSSNTPQGTTGQTQFGGTNGATWQITGIQLEVDSGSGVATDFEHRSYAQELALCGRYYQKLIEGNTKALGIGFAYNGSTVQMVLQYPLGKMRTTPSIDAVTGADYWRVEGGGITVNVDGSWVAEHARDTQMAFYGVPDATLSTLGLAHYVRSNNSAAEFAFSAEL